MRADLLFALGLLAPRAGWLAAGAALALLSLALGVGLLALAGLAVAAAGTGAAAALPLAWVRLLAPARVVARYVERLATHSAMFRLLAGLRVWLFRRLAALGPAALGLRRGGELLGRMLADIDALDGLYLRVMVPLGVALLASVLAVAGFLWLDPVLALVPLALLAGGVVALPLMLARASARAGAAVGERLEGLRIVAVDAAEGVREIAGFGAEQRMLARMRVATEALHAAQGRAARLSGLGGALAVGAVQAAALAALVAGGGRVAAGALGAGALALALFALLALGEALAPLSRAAHALGQAAGAAGRLRVLAEAGPPIVDPPAPAPMPAGFALRLEGVRARHAPDRPPALDGLDLAIPEGARVAIIGESGAGKSTLAALLLRMLAAEAGRITMGGVDLATLPAEAVRARFAPLAQDTALLSASIRDNLLLGRPDADDAALWAALEAARVAAFVRGLPEGLGTWCGEFGAQLSGGEARRIALARALLSPAPILLLDEPTAGLDRETAEGFLATLNAAAGGRTVILITHHLAGIERLDAVLRITAGRADPVPLPAPPATG